MSSRYVSLDALRGIASFGVLTHHHLLASSNVFPWWHLDSTPLRVLLQGRAFVILFFVLSGFVLTFGFLGPRPAKYWPYAARRLCRIYLPFAGIVVIAALAMAAIAPAPLADAPPWVNSLWDRPIGLPVVFENLLMTGSVYDSDIDVVAWSLIYELRISLAMPLLVMLVRTNTRCAIGLSLVLSLVCARFGAEHCPTFAETAADAVLATVYFVTAFAIGIALAVHLDSVRTAVGRAPRWLPVVLAPAAFLLLQWEDLAELGDALAALGAAILIALCVGSPAVAQALRVRPLAWLGRVSYSLYLLHLPVLLIFLHLGSGRAPLGLVLAMSAATSLLLAELSYRYLERPSIELGRQIARQFSLRPVAVRD